MQQLITIPSTEAIFTFLWGALGGVGATLLVQGLLSMWLELKRYRYMTSKAVVEDCDGIPNTKPKKTLEFE